ncbi:MAG TPA: FAD-binding protein [Solirubrobacteraceae bacterium]
MTAPEIAERLAEGRPVRIAGGGTRRGWGRPVEAGDEVSTAGLGAIVEHSRGDFTAILEAGVKVADAQAAFAEAGQMWAVDPPMLPGATIGGLVATADSGPRRHRYGPPRDLIIGAEVALSDGTVAKAGGKVIKNVAGYDLAKLMAGAFGTLGVITRVSVRLHPLPEATATAVFQSGEPEELGRIAADLAHRPFELDALDVRYAGGEGAILARFAGATAAQQARELVDDGAQVVEDDEALWEAQRAGQRGEAPAAVVRVSALQTELPDVLRAADVVGARVVGRAGAGVAYVTLPLADAEAVRTLRAELDPAACVVLDAPQELRAALDPWGVPDGPELELARRVKARFDPAGVCNPGIFIGGI